MSTSEAMSHSLTCSILERIELTFHVAMSKALKIYCLSYYHVNSDESLVVNQTARLIVGKIFLTLVFTPIVVITWRGGPFSRVTKIVELKNYSIDEKRDIYKTFDSENQNDQGLPIDPFDLMNRLKQAGTMNNATTPSDALDEALNAFVESEYENVPIK